MIVPDDKAHQKKNKKKQTNFANANQNCDEFHSYLYLSFINFVLLNDLIFRCKIKLYDLYYLKNVIIQKSHYSKIWTYYGFAFR